MGFQKKRNLIIFAWCFVGSYITYQLYIFTSITKINTENNQLAEALDPDKNKFGSHYRSEDDKFINENGMIRGTFYKRLGDYRPDLNNKFRCRTSEQYIPFEQVNDDYCDCEDGTDEPSTNACPIGVFYCDIQNYQKIEKYFIPSSKVNDGICDCCDGSDEWINKKNTKLLSQSSSKHYRFYVTTCPNICKM